MAVRAKAGLAVSLSPSLLCSIHTPDQQTGSGWRMLLNQLPEKLVIVTAGAVRLGQAKVVLGARMKFDGRYPAR